jgi:hypothetical protein
MRHFNRPEHKFQRIFFKELSISVFLNRRDADTFSTGT